MHVLKPDNSSRENVTVCGISFCKLGAQQTNSSYHAPELFIQLDVTLEHLLTCTAAPGLHVFNVTRLKGNLQAYT